jgi:type IV pilus assembly protein PilE
MKTGPATSPQAGATLVEWVGAAVMVAILIAIGIPTYRHHVLRVKRSDAPRELLTLAHQLQRCHKRTGSYARREDGPGACATLPYAIPESDYRVSGDIGTDTFVLKATPTGTQASDEHCGEFTLDQTGQQGVTGTSAADPRECWGDRGN